MLYGAAGTVSLSGIADVRSSGSNDTGVALIAAPSAVQIGAAPRSPVDPASPSLDHRLYGRVHQIAAFGALLRVLYVAGGIR